MINNNTKLFKDYSFLNRKVIIAVLIGFLLGCLITCSGSKEDTTKTTKTIEVKEKIIHIKDKPEVVYKNKYITKESLKTDTIYKTIKEDYAYTIDTTYVDKNGETKLKVDGFGGINNIEVTTKYKDSIITIEKETTKYVNKNTLYISPTYNTRKEIGLDLDYTIRNKVIVGGKVSYDPITGQPVAGVKIGLKL